MKPVPMDKLGTFVRKVLDNKKTSEEILNA